MGLPNPYATGKQQGLPNPYASAAVASAPPVKYSEEQAKAEQQKKATHAFHNPHNIKRPQNKKAAPVIKKPVMPSVSAAIAETAPEPTIAPQQHGLDYYLSTADDDAAILEEKKQREYEDRQRKKDKKKFEKQYGYWEPTRQHKAERYSNLKAYRASGGWYHAKQAFRGFLQKAVDEIDRAHQSNSSSGVSRSQSPAPSGALETPVLNDRTTTSSVENHLEDASSASHVQAPQPPPPSQSAPSSEVPPPPPPASATGSMAAIYQAATISAPPVRFERPDVEMDDINEPMPEDRPVKRQKISKGEAMLAKMGWTKGQGLGKNNDGVVSHLEVKMRKVPQGASIFDDEGGRVKSQQVWDVRGGMRTQKDEPGKFGEESSVVVAWGCVDNIDWDANAQRDDGGIRQEMGEVFSAKFGPVQQVQLDENSKDGAVYIKFESVLSALNAVNRFDEGYEFQGRKIRAHYYDEKKWNAGVWDH